MLLSTPGATQLFHTLPACLEDLNMDALSNGDLLGDNIQQLFEEFLSSAQPEILKLYSESEMQYSSAAPGLVFGNGKTPSSDADQRNVNSPVIPLSVQQAQLDNIDPETISQSDCIKDDVFGFVTGDDGAPTATTTLPHLPAERLTQTSPDTTDQTVPFRRHDSVCSVLSSCSDIKTERRSLSTEVESITTPSPFPTTPQLLNHGGRRGRPCSNDYSDSAVLTDKRLRRREQNRRAATKCRNKRRLEYEQLRKNHDVVMKQNAELKAQLIQLATHFERLQNKFDRHQQQCGLALPPNYTFVV